MKDTHFFIVFFFFFEGEIFQRCYWNVYDLFWGGNDQKLVRRPPRRATVLQDSPVLVEWIRDSYGRSQFGAETQIWKGFFKAYIDNDQSWLLYKLYVLRKLKAPEWLTFESAEQKSAMKHSSSILHCRSDKNWRPPLKSFAKSRRS